MNRSLRRAGVAAVTLVVLTAAIATADSITGDSDTLTAGLQSSRNLGEVAPGAQLDVPVSFTLKCGSTQHVDAGQSVVLSTASESVPADGALGFDPVTIGPIPAGWATDGAFCSTEVPLTGSGTVRVTAPSVSGTYDYSLFFARSLTPAGLNDPYALTGYTAVGFSLTVITNTPPVLTVPADITVEGNTTGGAVVEFDATATDAEDDPAPTPVCTPPSGSTFPLGLTTVDCAVTDGGGLTDEASFNVTVVDTTPPALRGVPADLDLTTTDPAGATLDYDLPTATDIVDASPSVTCDRMPGAPVQVGDTTVTCTATDDSGNSASASFAVHVTLLAALWEEPVGAPATITANAGRNIPVKVHLYRNGVEVDTGRATVAVLSGDGHVLTATTLAWSGGRWQGNLDTTGLAPGAYRAVARLDGATAGAFSLDLRGQSTATKAGGTSSRP